MVCGRVAWHVIPMAIGGRTIELTKRLSHEDFIHMDTLIFNEGLLSTVTVLGTVLFLNSMLIFLSGKHREHKLLDRSSVWTFSLLWLGTLIFEPALETKAYISSLAVSLIVVRILVTRERKRRASGR